MKCLIITIAIGINLSFNAQITPSKENQTSLPLRKTQLSSAEIKALDSLNIDFQLRGNCYAYSSDKNKIESNGEAHSNNLPSKIDESFPKNGFYLIINSQEFIKYGDKTLGSKLYLINTTDSVVTLQAQDSRLYILPEVLNNDGNWLAIGYNPSSWCGNSYHMVKLDMGEFWQFEIPIFSGSFKTKLRYVLTLNDGKKLYSNEIDVRINKKQLNPKNIQGHTNQGLMDPYEE